MSDKTQRKVSRFASLKAEFAKIFWADKKSVTKQTASVIIISAIVAVIIIFVDMLIQFGLDNFFKL